MTDNAFSYVRNRSLRELLARHGIRHLTTRAYRPRTNGKVERFHQTAGSTTAASGSLGSTRGDGVVHCRSRRGTRWQHANQGCSGQRTRPNCATARWNGSRTSSSSRRAGSRSRAFRWHRRRKRSTGAGGCHFPVKIRGRVSLVQSGFAEPKGRTTAVRSSRDRRKRRTASGDLGRPAGIRAAEPHARNQPPMQAIRASGAAQESTYRSWG